LRLPFTIGFSASYEQAVHWIVQEYVKMPRKLATKPENQL
jgi:hypothetical protein